MAKNTEGEVITIIIVGDGGVGKSALSVRLVENRFDPDYNPTIEDAFTKRLRVDGQQATLKIVDTAGQEEYSALREAHYAKADAFILVYSITDRNGFDSIPKFRSKILTLLDVSEIPMTVVGNKSDMAEYRKVATREGQDLAKSFGDIPFKETSAKTSSNVEETFADVVRLVRKANSGAATPSGPSSGRRKSTATDDPAYFKKKKCIIA
eukprot:m51a1_g352 putative ras gtpase (209) ;mRNA; r:569975-570924